jgi:hypothetical protein
VAGVDLVERQGGHVQQGVGHGYLLQVLVSCTYISTK